MQHENVEVMNQILRGEHMAIGIYDTYLKSLPEGDLQASLIRIRDEHNHHAALLEGYVEQAGGDPVESSGMIGSMANLMGKVKTMVHPEPQDILRQLYDGEDKGLARAVQLSEHKLGDPEKQLLEQIFADEHDHLKKLQQLLSRYE